jgi:hypothetical protein
MGLNSTQFGLLSSDADPDQVPDPAYHFDADPYPDLMWMRIRTGIQFTKMMRIPADPDAQHWLLSRPHMQMFWIAFNTLFE